MEKRLIFQYTGICAGRFEVNSISYGKEQGSLCNGVGLMQVADKKSNMKLVKNGK
jgi:hypothetical protein